MQTEKDKNSANKTRERKMMAMLEILGHHDWF